MNGTTFKLPAVDLAKEPQSRQVFEDGFNHKGGTDANRKRANMKGSVYKKRDCWKTDRAFELHRQASAHTRKVENEAKT